MFLSMWDYFDGTDGSSDGYAAYKPESFPEFPAERCGVIQPYQDNPADDVATGEAVYLNMIYGAKKYVYVTTPYLIIDYQIEQALIHAAASGVDVRIVTPAIPDKPMVFESTKGHYKRLVSAGVKLYEFTPGFLHSKTFICDGEFASVGTINLDYRSLYLHFECGLWMYRAPAIADVRADFEGIFAVSKQITEEDCRVNVFRRVFRSLIELIAPMI